MKKTGGKNTQKSNTPARRLLLNKETIRNLLTEDQLKAVQGGFGNVMAAGDTDNDGNGSRNNVSGH